MLLKEQIKKTQILGKHSKNEKKSLVLNFPGTFSQLKVNSKDTRMTFKYVFLRFFVGDTDRVFAPWGYICSSFMISHKEK